MCNELKLVKKLPPQNVLTCADLTLLLPAPLLATRVQVTRVYGSCPQEVAFVASVGSFCICPPGHDC